MGCLKILHNEQKSALSESWKIFVGGVEKTLSSEKNRINYYPGGSLQPGRSFNANSYAFSYQGSEKDDEIAGSGNHITTYFRENDTRLLRWWSTDPKASAGWSPYASMQGNPILWNDVLGDTIPAGGKKFGSTETFKKIKIEAKKQAGLNLYITSDGYVQYTRNSATGNPTKYRKGFSPTARAMWMAVINSPNYLGIAETKTGSRLDYNSPDDGDGYNYDVLFIDPSQVKELMYNLSFNSNLDTRTTGFGMTVLHEFDHWLNGTSDPEDPAGQPSSQNIMSSFQGATVQSTNVIRQELTNAGVGNYGQRTSYFMKVDNILVITFSTASRNLLMGYGTLKKDYTFVLPKTKEFRNYANDRDWSIPNQSPNFQLPVTPK